MRLFTYILLLGFTLGLSTPGYSANTSTVSLQQVDATLNKVYRDLKNTRTPRAQKTLLKTQNEWLKKRDRVCQLEGLPDQRKAWLNALAKDTTKHQCVIKKTQDRIARLRANQMTPPEVVFTHPAQEKYPPYPEVWGYELPYPSEVDRFSLIKPFKNDNGDLLFAYIEKKAIRKSKNGIADKELYPAIVNFFANKSRSLSKSEYKKFWKDNRSMRMRPNPWQKITFDNGTYIRQRGTGGGNCYGPYRYYLERRGKNNTVVARKTLAYLMPSLMKIPLNPSCGDGEGTIIERVAAGYLKVINLEDDTFLVYEADGNVILRLDNKFKTKFPMNNNVFLIDTNVIDKIKKDAKSKYPSGVNFYQYINDAVYDYVLTLKKRAGK